MLAGHLDASRCEHMKLANVTVFSFFRNFCVGTVTERHDKQ